MRHVSSSASSRSGSSGSSGSCSDRSRDLDRVRHLVARINDRHRAARSASHRDESCLISAPSSEFAMRSASGSGGSPSGRASSDAASRRRDAGSPGQSGSSSSSGSSDRGWSGSCGTMREGSIVSTGWPSVDAALRPRDGDDAARGGLQRGGLHEWFGVSLATSSLHHEERTGDPSSAAGHAAPGSGERMSRHAARGPGAALARWQTPRAILLHLARQARLSWCAHHQRPSGEAGLIVWIGQRVWPQGGGVVSCSTCRGRSWPGGGRSFCSVCSFMVTAGCG